MKIKALVIFITLAAIWGASFILMRVSAPEFGAMPTAFVRCAIAAMTLSLLAMGLRKPMLRGVQLRWAMCIGVLNSAVPFALFGYALQILPAGYGSVLNATVPFWGLAIGALFFGEAIAPQKLMALGVAIVGLSMVLGLGTLPITATVLLAAGALIAATLLYAISGTISQRKLKGVDSFGQAWAAMLGASLVLIPLAAIYWPNAMPSAGAWAAVISLGLMCSAVAYLLFFWLIVNMGLLWGMSVTLLIPVFGILWGVLFLGETMTWASGLGAVITLCATAVVLDVVKIKTKLNQN